MKVNLKKVNAMVKEDSMFITEASYMKEILLRVSSMGMEDSIMMMKI